MAYTAAQRTCTDAAGAPHSKVSGDGVVPDDVTVVEIAAEEARTKDNAIAAKMRFIPYYLRLEFDFAVCIGRCMKSTHQIQGCQQVRVRNKLPWQLPATWDI
jgi:hypothetical protein